METKKRNQIPSFIKVPEHLETVKEMLSPDVLTFCAQNPRNGYPVGDPCHHFHIVSESGLTDKVTTDIYKADKKRIYKGVEHMFAILPDDEYAVLHKAAKKSESPTITRVFTMEIAKHELDSLDPGTILELLVEPLLNPYNGTEVIHFIPKSIWDDEAEASLEIEDLHNGTSGVISHYVNIIDDDDLDDIYNLIYETILENKYTENKTN